VFMRLASLYWRSLSSPRSMLIILMLRKHPQCHPQSRRPFHHQYMYSQQSAWEWWIFDVGGCRTLRKAWLPYFDNVNVIIFLSPVSVFDQRLEEDHSVNHLEDSIILWTSICPSKLLAKTQLILFLNKCDLLRWKLKRGIEDF